MKDFETADKVETYDDLKVKFERIQWENIRLWDKIEEMDRNAETMLNDLGRKHEEWTSSEY